MPQDINLAYCRACLKSVIQDVRRHDELADIHSAWVYKFTRGHWEFHYGDFYWHGSADNAAEARSAGWSAWLAKQGAEGYVS